jgi:[protein-PII] uridylyltransferase
MSRLRPSVLAAKQRLAEGHQRLKQRHEAACSGVELCAEISSMRDQVLRALFESALADLSGNNRSPLASQIALVAHGGYGRCDVAPYSDVDLMILHTPASTDRVVPLAERLLRDVFDAGLVLGHSVRTPAQACRLACADPLICTSLMESRLLLGEKGLFDSYFRRFRRHVRQRSRGLAASIYRSRLKERAR